MRERPEMRHVPKAIAAHTPPPVQRVGTATNGVSLDHRQAAGVPLGPARSDALPARLQRGIEALSGVAVDDVRVHRGSPKPAAIGAHAYAQGRDIHVAPGQDRHLPHEAWHVVQQKQGRVKATVQRAGRAPLNDSADLEREADTMGARAATAGAAPAASAPLIRGAPHRAGPAPVQRYRTVNRSTRVSDGGNLCLIGKRDLYAGDAQFAQANALQGAVAFTKGDRLPQAEVPGLAGDLRQVEASLKPNFNLEALGFTTDASGTVSSHDPQTVLEDFDDLNNPAKRGNGFNGKSVKNYKRSLRGAGGPLLPSDCGITSRVVTGHLNHPEDGASTVMQPGSIYQYTSEHHEREWPYHLAGVIMTDGPDHVTMENAAARASQQFSKYTVDQGWWYDMFGPKSSQTFESKYGGSLPHGTLRRIHPPPPSPPPPPGLLTRIWRGVFG